MKRIQRKRTLGWMMPRNTKYVGRPSRWGNPYKVEEYGLVISLLKYKSYVKETLICNPDWLDDLDGKDLCCWCSLGKKCHADILIEILAEKANTTRLTAKKYLLKLMKDGVVVGKEYTGKEFKKGLYWWLKYE